MVESNLFARVYLTCNGGIYIAFASGKIIVCSARSLSCLLSNPFDLHKGMGGEFKDISKMTNPQKYALDKIPGLTLVTVGADGASSCEYPVIMKKVYMSSLPSQQNDPLRLHASDFSSLQDEKHFFLRTFCVLIEAFQGPSRFKNGAPTTDEFRLRFFEESLRAFGIETAEHETPITSEPSFATANSCVETDNLLNHKEMDEANRAAVLPFEIPPNYISAPDFAELHGVLTVTVHGWIHKGKIPCEKYVKLSNNRFYIDADTPKPVDGRSTRYKNAKEKTPRRPKYSRKNASFQDTQKRIQDDNIVSAAIRPFIRDYGEAQYYRKHAYHEVELNGKPALIIDIVPEYYSESLGKTNRELIQEGKSPVVPNHEDQHFHLHHIGQKKESPLAIIPECDHNSEALYSVFHSNCDCDTGIHGKDFEAEKKAFWLSYLELYDAHGQNYKKIPYINKRNRLARSQREWRE